MATLLLAVGLIACSDSSCASGCDERGSGQEDTAAMVYSTDEPPPLWTLDEVGQQLETLLSFGAPNPVDISETYQRVMAEGDELCPGDPRDLGQILGCTAENGYFYSGIAWLEVSETTQVEDHEVLLDWYHGGDFEILRTDGTRFAGGGDLEYDTEPLEEEDADTPIDGGLTTFTVAGTWVDDSQSGWMGQGFSGVYTGELTVSGPDYALSINGGVAVGELDLNFVEMGWSTAGDCQGATTGAVQLRDARGYWYEWDLGVDCDGCGQVIFHQDQDLGELCLDLDDWGGAMVALSRPR